MSAHKQQSGITLIEISIVLVIIGLMIGGVVAGRAMLRSSDIQGIVTDQQMLATAFQAFQTKYGELPGDMTRATQYWGTDPAGCPNLGTWGLVPKVTTCNGNGNGFIQNPGSDYGLSAMYEQVQAWQHMANAGILKGAFTGTPGPVNYIDMRPGINVPASRLPNSGFELYSFVASTSTYAWFVGPVYNTPYLVFGASSNSGSEMFGRVLTTQDALMIDKKIDDGKPGLGIVLASNSTYGLDYPACSTTDVSSTATYNVTLKNVTCTLLFKLNL